MGIQQKHVGGQCSMVGDSQRYLVAHVEHLDESMGI